MPPQLHAHMCNLDVLHVVQGEQGLLKIIKKGSTFSKCLCEEELGTAHGTSRPMPAGNGHRDGHLICPVPGVAASATAQQIPSCAAHLPWGECLTVDIRVWSIGITSIMLQLKGCAHSSNLRAPQHKQVDKQTYG